MTVETPTILALRLKGLLPSMTPAQVICCRDLLERVNREAWPQAVEVVELYPEMHAEFSVCAFKAELRNRCAMPLESVDEKQQRQRTLVTEIQAVDRHVAGLTDAELAKKKDLVLQSLPDWTAVHLEKRDARRNPVLKALIYELDHAGNSPAIATAPGRKIHA